MLCSCEQAFIKNNPEPDNVAVFDHLWETVDQKYSFFIDKNIDWDAAKSRYRNEARSAKNSLELFDALAAMLFLLEDGHVNLSAGIDLSRNWQWYLDYPANFNWDIVERNYLIPSEAYQISGSLHNTIIDDVGYIYYESFSNNVSTNLMDYVIQKFETGDFVCADTCAVKGIIIDVRNNGGGSISNAFTITNRFADEKIKVADWYYKTGPGHDAFDEVETKYIEFEGNEDYVFNKPIVVLTNRSSFSSSNFFASMMSFLPNVTIMGDNTGGGGGLPINSELLNGWRVRFSATRTIDAQGRNIEFGVAPDIKIDLDTADILRGKDTIIESAIDFIHAQQ
jgi:C-terminal processing protease CtpA/Prc